MPVELLPNLTTALAGRYRVERVLGSGGMATVFLADDTRHHRKVAIKVLDPELGAVLGRERFFREIELTASLQHPHILPLFDSGVVPATTEHDGLLYYVMPYVDGESLRERLRRERQLPIDEAVALTREVADALTYAAAHGVVHRDIKPENILLTGSRDGTGEGTATHALVADFGIARAIAETGGDRLTRTGVALGTPAYMSPEQGSGDSHVDARSDVYALGCVLYEMLIGQPPFTGPTAQSVLAKHLTEPVPQARRLRDRVPENVDTAIGRALAKLGADRFPTARQFADALVTPVDMRQTSSPSPVPSGATPGPGRKRRLLLTGVAVAAAAGLLVALSTDAGGLRRRLTGRPRPATTSAVEGRQSVAVLPFDNVGGNPVEEYFSDGLTEELIAALSQVRSLRVAARTSTFALKGQTRDVRDVGRALNVGTVLVGSVRKAQNRIRVTAQLIDASNGLDLWSQTYDERELADVFDIQADIARRIAVSLAASLTPSEQQRLAAKPTDNLEAYTLYLKGRYFWNKRGAQMDSAIHYFNRAIAIDSTYARAYAGLASAYGPLGVHGYIHPRLGRERMGAAAQRALELDDRLAEAHTVLGAYLHVYEWNWDGAEREFRRAIQLDRNDPTAHSWYGHFLENMGRFDEAIPERRLSVELDPLVPHAGLGATLTFAGRYDSARVAFRHALEIDPNFWQTNAWLGSLLTVTGDLPGAIAAYERAVATSQGAAGPKAALARALALSGRKAEAREVVRRIRAEAAASGIQHPDVATALLALGDTTAAFDWLEGSFRQRHPAMASINVNPAYAGFRADPRFQDLLRRMRFPSSSTTAAR